MNKLRQFLMIEMATMLFAFSIGLFILPGKVLTGGVAGIATLLKPYVAISEDYLVIIINTLLFIIGSILLGKEFFLNTLVYSVSYPFMLLLVTRHLPPISIDPLLAALYGGLIGGVAIGIMFRNGGSSGGVDVIALVMEKYFHIRPSNTVMVVDALTVIAGLYVYGFNSVLIGLLSVYMLSFAMDQTINMYRGIEGKKFEIISDKYEEINEAILKKIDRGTTILNGVGGYSHQERKVLMAVVSNEQLSEVKKVVDEIDPNAFVIISDTKDINGEGFTFEPRL
ncbi:MAG: YitT family protein [Erysipelotrichaceae bacterium]|nr:YitT family protein [Erysipelotrichaceae bacterium]